MIVLTCLVLTLMSGNYAFDRFEYSNYIHWLLHDVHHHLAAQLIADYHIDASDAVLEILFTAPFVSLEMAQQSDARFAVLASDSTDRWFSSARINGLGFASRFTVETGTPDALPFPDGSFDFVIARDAMRFWHDDPVVFSEINRVLKDNGVALLGSGFANTVDDTLDTNLWNMKENWWKGHDKTAWFSSTPYPERIEAALTAARISDFRIWDEDGNTNRTWIEWHKLKPAAGDILDMDSILTAQGALRIGDKAPDFTLTGPSRDTVTLSHLAGDVVVLAFWKTHYSDWTIMTHDIKPIYDSLKSEGLHILTINIDEDSARVGFYYMDFPIPFPVLYDGLGISRRYGIRGIPQFVVIDRQGAFSSRIMGCTDDTIEELRNTITALVRKSAEPDER